MAAELAVLVEAAQARSAVTPLESVRA
jgi:hypothetical protein